MKKNFLNVTPDSGSSDQTVSVTADANPTFKERSETLTFSATGGISKTFSVNQLSNSIWGTMAIVNPSITTSKPFSPYSSNVIFSIDSDGVLKEERQYNSRTFDQQILEYQYTFLIHKDIIENQISQIESPISIQFRNRGGDWVYETNDLIPELLSGTDYYICEFMKEQSTSEGFEIIVDFKLDFNEGAKSVLRYHTHIGGENG